MKKWSVESGFLTNKGVKAFIGKECVFFTFIFDAFLKHKMIPN